MLSLSPKAKEHPMIFSAPQLQTMLDRHFAGPVVTYDMTTRSQIPGQWGAYNDMAIRVETPEPAAYYGLAFHVAPDMSHFDYLCGQEVALSTPLPSTFRRVTAPGGTWARFVTKGHISTMQDAWAEVYGHWSGQAGLIPRSAPSIEYYPPEFDGENGGYELWLPVS
jgi:AraC family transcriptional regulator